MFKAGGVPGHFWIPDATQAVGKAVAAFLTTTDVLACCYASAFPVDFVTGRCSSTCATSLGSRLCRHGSSIRARSRYRRRRHPVNRRLSPRPLNGLCLHKSLRARISSGYSGRDFCHGIAPETCIGNLTVQRSPHQLVVKAHSPPTTSSLLCCGGLQGVRPPTRMTHRRCPDRHHRRTRWRPSE